MKNLVIDEQKELLQRLNLKQKEEKTKKMS